MYCHLLFIISRINIKGAARGEIKAELCDLQLTHYWQHYSFTIYLWNQKLAHNKRHTYYFSNQQQQQQLLYWNLQNEFVVKRDYFKVVKQVTFWEDRVWIVIILLLLFIWRQLHLLLMEYVCVSYLCQALIIKQSWHSLISSVCVCKQIFALFKSNTFRCNLQTTTASQIHEKTTQIKWDHWRD